MPDETRHRILVVDDSETNIDILDELLGDDHEVQIAMDGPSALELVEEEPPDIILLDIMMPGMDGYEVCEKLKSDAQTRKIPVIFITAMTSEENEEKGLGLGAVDYIAKPFSPEIVKARVKTHLQLVQQVQILEENLHLQEEIENITRHDLKSPLNAVISIPAMMKKAGNLNREQVEMLGMLESSGYRMLEIINNSLNLVKMEKGTYTVSPVNLDLIELIQEVHGESLELIKTKNLTIKIDCLGRRAKKGDRFEVYGEEVLCYSMLANLIKNALEASPDNGSVVISLNAPMPADQTQGSGLSEIRIRNAGRVPADMRDCFFEKYTTSGKKDGTGLGTYSAKLIAETLGGSIGFESGQSKGTTVWVRLPEKAEPLTCNGTPGQACRDDGQWDACNNVLIVDDFESMRKIVIHGTRQMGIRHYKEAEDGHSAIALLKKEKFDLVISDNTMPVMTGLELARHMKTKPELKDIPFIMMTGESRQETILAAAKAGIKSFLVKPFPIDLLIKKIKKACSPPA